MTFPYLNETKELDETARKQADGSFIALTDGVTHYELGGPKNGQPVVLVHGFSTPYFIFDTTFEFLVNSGFRVLRYDLIGRGYSDRPHVDYNIHLFVRQLKDLLDALELKPDKPDRAFHGRIDHNFFHQRVSRSCQQAGVDRPRRRKTSVTSMDAQSHETAHPWRTGSRSVWKREYGQGYCI